MAKASASEPSFQQASHSASRLSVLRDWVIATDPGFEHLRTGARACLSAGLSALALTEAAQWLHRPAKETLIGVIVAMSTSIAINDRRPRAQKLSTLLGAVVASLSLACGAAATNVSQALGDAVFLLVIFAAVFVRHFGQRFVGLGFVLFLTYFYSVFFKPSFAQLPWMIECIFAATGIGFAVRFWLIRDHPERSLSHSLAAFHVQTRLVLSQLSKLVAGIKPLSWRKRSVRRHLYKLNQTALDMETQISGEAGWRNALLRVEMSVESLADVILHDEAEVSDRAGVRALLAALSRRVDNSALRLTEGMRGGRIAASAREFLDNVQAIRTVLDGDTGQDAEGGGGAQSPDWKESLRHATQATAAGIAALFAGHYFSPVRWYWAMIAAFVVFSRSTTVAETFVRAWQRILGTAIGVPAALGIAELVAGHKDAELAVLFACVFGAYYFLRTSYGWTVLFFTTALAVLYTLLGKYSPGLLVLRLEETLTGVVLGVLAAALIFPVKSRAKVRQSTVDLLREIAVMLEEIPQQEDHREQVRDLDRQYQALQSAATPFTDSVLAVGSNRLKSTIRGLSRLVYTARELTQRYPHAPQQVFEETARTLAANVRAQADAMELHTHPKLKSIETNLLRLYDKDPLTARWFDRMNSAIEDLSGRL